MLFDLLSFVSAEVAEERGEAGSVFEMAALCATALGQGFKVAEHLGQRIDLPTCRASTARRFPHEEQVN